MNRTSFLLLTSVINTGNTDSQFQCVENDIQNVEGIINQHQVLQLLLVLVYIQLIGGF